LSQASYGKSAIPALTRNYALQQLLMLPALSPVALRRNKLEWTGGLMSYAYGPATVNVMTNAVKSSGITNPDRVSRYPRRC